MTVMINGVQARIDETGLEWTLDKLLEGAGVGADPTEIDVPLPGPTIVRKTADETVNNSTTLQNDDHLLLAVAANEIWFAEFLIVYRSNAAPDFKYTFTVPTGCTLYWGLLGGVGGGHWSGGATLKPAEQTQTAQGVDAATDSGIRAVLLIVNGANAGNIQLQWAQNAAEVSDTKVMTNSFIIASKLA